MASQFFNFHLHNRHNEINLMNVDKKRYKYGKLLIFACFFLYTSSMAAKGIFAAQMQFLSGLWGVNYAKINLSNTFYFVTYGLVQVVLFFFMNKISLRKYVLWTVPFAAITTALIGLSTGVEQVWIYFGISGAFQAAIFSACNLMLTRYLPIKLLSKANTILTLGYAVGSVVAYLLSALFVGFGGEAWRVPYFIIGAIFMLSLITFAIIVNVSKRFAKVNNLLDEKYIQEIKTQKNNAMDDTDPLITVESRKRTIIFYVVVLTMAFFITAVYYCIMNYITSLLVKVYGIPDNISIYVSILAPVMIAVGPIITIRSCDKHKDFIRQAIKYSLIILPIPLVMAFVFNLNIIVALILSLLFVIGANGVKAICLSVMAFKMRKVMNAGAYSCISNAIASVAAGVTPFVIGAIIDNYGWQAYYVVTFALCVLVLVAMLIIDLFVRRDYRIKHHYDAKDKID